MGALSIVDDMGAVLVIALFYAADIAWDALWTAGIILFLLIALNVLRVTRLVPYLVLGVGLWFFVHKSGVHATIAGVLLAFVIPTRTRINAAEFSTKARGLLDHFDRTETGDLLVLTSKRQQEGVSSEPSCCVLGALRSRNMLLCFASAIESADRPGGGRCR